MLKLMIGKAGSGKTAAMIAQIKAAVEAQQGQRILIVPEQYSHEAERELCRACGDSLSLYAEVFSFTGLARRVMSQQGGGAAAYLDKGGRLLCMALALGNVGSRLKVYSAAQHKAELQDMLLSAVDELKTACISPQRLEQAAEELSDGLGDKLLDLALVAESYDAVVANGHADPADRLNILAEQIPSSFMDEQTHVFVDGFIDFTRQEHEILRAMLKKGVHLTVCLTIDSMDGDSEIYELSRRAARSLLADACELNIEAETELFEFSPDKDGALNYFADNMFSYSRAKYEGESDAISLFSADSMEAECEFAAAKALELVREKGCRWRDIAIAIRGFDDYRARLESAFRHYGVPLFVTRRSKLLSKPLPALISGAYEILENGWDVDDLISYMRTGLAGLSMSECDELADYVFKWQLRATAWERETDWRQHPDGYGGEYDEVAEEKLRHINELRRKLSGPLLDFRRKAEKAETAQEQAEALARFFEDLHLAEKLCERAEELNAAGKENLAQEYQQLWELIVSALEQSAAILGRTEMDMSGFGKLFVLMLSKYDIGTIPVSLDRVSAGDFDRMRRRNIKWLIVLGVSDNRLPKADEDKGIFSDEERHRLLEMEIALGGGDGELWREFSLIYNCLTLPSQGIVMSYSLCGAEGEEQRAAFIFNRAKALFGLDRQTADINRARMAAMAPALTLAANAVRGGSPAATAAAEYFKKTAPERYELITAAADQSRGKLSYKSVEALYGKNLKLSASRIDKFSSCKFAYFCQYGLRAKPYEPAGFTPPEIGTFMHYVLEHTARDVKEQGGFKIIDDESLCRIADSYVDKYVHQELNDFQEKSSRFIYLFKRLTRDVHQVLADMAAELRKSDFVPLDFELDFSNASDIPPIELTEGGEKVTLTGIADRIDGWLHDGKLYLRVVDYKTGRKKFSLSDIWHGMGLQMLLYLFALESDGEKRYGSRIVPAGVMYVPARNAMLSLSRNVEDDEADRKRLDEIRRSGIVLDEESLIEAWENGEDKKFIPIKFRYGKPSAETIATAERLGLLSKHIKKSLSQMAQQLNSGSIAADPYYRSQQENACMNCDYFDACHFEDGSNGENCRYLSKLSADKVWGMLEGGAADE